MPGLRARNIGFDNPPNVFDGLEFRMVLRGSEDLASKGRSEVVDHIVWRGGMLTAQIVQSRFKQPLLKRNVSFCKPLLQCCFFTIRLREGVFCKGIMIRCVIENDKRMVRNMRQELVGHPRGKVLCIHRPMIVSSAPS